MGALFNGDGYKGFLFNVEMADGRFMPSYHDPLIHQADNWVKMPDCAADTQDLALQEARRRIDQIVRTQVDQVAAAIRDKFKRALA